MFNYQKTMERNIVFSEGEYYHIFNRGTEKRKIFLTNKDKDRFVKLLFVCNSKKPVVFKLIQGFPLEEIDRGETLVDVICYCLMDNHFHILLKEKIERGTSLFMNKLCTAYSMYFNTKNERTGNLFQGNFKAFHADEDKYLKYLFSYIHLNSIKLIDSAWKEKKITNIKKAKEFLQKYKYSSYVDYIGIKREEVLILNIKESPKYFEDKKEFEEITHEWLNYDNLEEV